MRVKEEKTSGSGGCVPVSRHGWWRRRRKGQRERQEERKRIEKKSTEMFSYSVAFSIRRCGQIASSRGVWTFVSQEKERAADPAAVREKGERRRGEYQKESAVLWRCSCPEEKKTAEGTSSVWVLA